MTAFIDEGVVFTASEHDTKDPSAGSDLVDRVGWYHFEIVRVDDRLAPTKRDGSAGTPHLLYRLRVLQHVEGQSPAGSVLFHRLYVFEKGGGQAGREKVKQMCRWAVGTGIAEFRDVDGKDVLIDKRSNSPAVTLVSLRNLVGCQIVAEVKKESSSQYGESFKISFCECFRPDDPKVAHVSKNHEAIRAREAFELCQCLPK